MKADPDRLRRLTVIILLLIVVIQLIYTLTEDRLPTIRNGRLVFVPSQGYVRDSATAEAIAEAIWLPLYGEIVTELKPYKVTLRGGSVWVVELAPESPTGKVLFFDAMPYIEIRRTDGKILFVSH